MGLGLMEQGFRGRRGGCLNLKAAGAAGEGYKGERYLSPVIVAGRQSCRTDASFVALINQRPREEQAIVDLSQDKSVPQERLKTILRYLSKSCLPFYLRKRLTSATA